MFTNLPVINRIWIWNQRRKFKKWTGMTPEDYLKRYRGKFVTSDQLGYYYRALLLEKVND